ncbi:Multiple PDZ domain protein [Geodia barretti]|uniref:Multiple PDZ domain protein n=1 Tax=Geodia barretti TaxID=519541 RepID=A0AA35R8F0_GEOBA|nr:Multiple PDZ domain protein [Geodia barretti]
MAVLGSLVGVFTFCVRRKRADDAVSRRKKTDERTQDDKVVERETSVGNRPTATTTIEDRTHSEAGAGENGIHPVITRGNEQKRPPNTELGEEENGGIPEDGERLKVGNSVRDEEAPAIKEETEEDNDRGVGERVGENGIEEVFGAATEQGTQEVATVNGGEAVAMVNGEVDGCEVVAMVNGDAGKRWSFPPLLEDFDLMNSDMDPAELEQLFADDRMLEIYLELEPDSPALGISIVGGSGSPSGDLPIIIKRVLPNSLAERDGRLKSGDELIAVNDTLLVGVAKDVAIETLSNLSGKVRLLVLQED